MTGPITKLTGHRAHAATRRAAQPEPSARRSVPEPPPGFAPATPTRRSNRNAGRESGPSYLTYPHHLLGAIWFQDTRLSTYGLAITRQMAQCVRAFGRSFESGLDDTVQYEFNLIID